MAVRRLLMDESELAILLVIVVEKFWSSPRAAANSFNVFNASGELSTSAATALLRLVSTYVFDA